MFVTAVVAAAGVLVIADAFIAVVPLSENHLSLQTDVQCDVAEEGSLDRQVEAIAHRGNGSVRELCQSVGGLYLVCGRD